MSARAPGSRLDREACSRAFVRASQYFANMLSDADVLAEGRELVRSAFAPELCCFCRPPRDGCASCEVPEPHRPTLRRAVDQVFDSGFMAMETLEGSPPIACVVLPVTVRSRVEVALVVGFEGEPSLPAHALEVLLGVAGLVGATLARQRADRELQALAEERAARAIAEVTERRSRLLSDASQALFSFGYEAALGRVARLVVPRLADACAIDLRDERRPDGTRECTVHVERGPFETYRRVRERVLARASEVVAILEGGAPRLGPRSIVVPMAARTGVLGVITLVGDAPRAPFGPDELALAEELGRRAGSAIENALLFRQAQEAVGVRDQFLAVASHELKTPITALMLILSSTERSLAKIPDAPTAMRNKIAALARQGRRLDQLVKDLLDVSRIQSGRLHVSIEQVDLCAVVREVVERHLQEATQAGCTIEVAADGSAVGPWDHSRVDQVVSNLVSNAIKYGAGKPISIAARADGDTAVLTVADGGIGIAPEDQERIFRRFERAVASDAFTGLGLGLWIVREILARLGGTIRVVSALGEGARFVVELPRAAQGASERAPAG